MLKQQNLHKMNLMQIMVIVILSAGQNVKSKCVFIIIIAFVLSLMLPIIYWLSNIVYVLWTYYDIIDSIYHTSE